MSTTRIVKAVLNNEQAVLPVSAYLSNQYSQKDIFTGVPSVVDENGVREIIELAITDEEQESFNRSVSELQAVLDTVK